MLSVLLIEGNDLEASPSLCGAVPVPRHRHVILERGQQKGTESPLFAADAAKSFLFKQMKEKTLGQIFGICGVMPLRLANAYKGYQYSLQSSDNAVRHSVVDSAGPLSFTSKSQSQGGI